MSDERKPAEPEPGSPITRRTALKVIAGGAAVGGAAAACGEGTGEESAHESLSGFAPPPASNALAAGTPTDPDLLAPVVPWEKVLSDEEMRLVSVLCDVIIPADERSPAASEVGVPEYINEFVSAPSNESDLITLRGGLAWLNRMARERFSAPDFPALTAQQRSAICEEIRYEPDAPEELKPYARFFDLFRDMTSTGFWTTGEGMADLGYVGNVPLPSFDGPPPEVIRALGLAADDLL